MYSIRTQSLCQGLFSGALRAHRGAQSSSSRRELVYSNRLFRVCQALFSRYLSELPDFRPLIALVLALSLSAQIIYQTLPLLSTPFPNFLLLFSFPLFMPLLRISFTCVTLKLHLLYIEITILGRLHHMPIKIPDLLPARSVLEGENIFVMTEHRAIHQDIRPLNVLILNLMPTRSSPRHRSCASSPIRLSR